MIKINKPKIRFKNFNDSWSLRKLSDTQTDFKDGNYGEAYPKETDLTSSTQGVPFLRGSFQMGKSCIVKRMFLLI